MTPEGYKPVRVSLTGIDGAGKDTVAYASLSRLALEGNNIVKLGRPSYALVPGSTEPQPMFSVATKALDKLHSLADMYESRLGICTVNACNVLVQSRLLEPRATHYGSQVPDIIASSRDPRIDPAAYCRFYAPGLSKSVSLPKRLHLFQALTGVTRDLIIHLKVSPDLAVQRIEERIAREATSNCSDSLRLKWRHMHEYTEYLEMLGAEQEAALAHLQDMTPTTVLTLDTDNLSVVQTSEQAYQAMGSAIESRVQNG